MVKHKRFSVILAVLFFLIWAVFLFLPVTERVNGCEEIYLCRWEDGTRTRENFADAYSAVTGCDPDRILLTRGEIAGEIEPASPYSAYFRTLSIGSFREVKELDVSKLGALERAVLWERFGDRAWWTGEEFLVWTESGAVFSHSPRCGEIIIEGGSLTASAIARTCADSLEVRDGADFSAKMLIGTEITELKGVAPYDSENGALYLETLGGTRLVAAAPNVRSLSADYDYADEGALLACRELEFVSLPFAGTSRFSELGDHRSEIASLFLSGEEYFVPPTLKRIEIRGGVLTDTSLYRCDYVEEIVLCGMKEEQVSRSAFLSCAALKKLHAPIGDALLTGKYSARTLDCGCTLYTKEA